MSNIYDMSGKKKVVFTEETELDITYKQIMEIIIEHSTEKVCHKIFCYGGINMCPSEIFGDKIDKQQEYDDCNYNSIGCTKCWTKAVKQLGGLI